MLYAVIARPPVLGGKVKSFDAAEAMKVPGVVKVFAIDGTPPPSEFMPVGGIVVVGKDTWAAIKGRKALKIDWDDGAHGSYDSAAFRTRAGGGGAEARRQGRAQRGRRLRGAGQAPRRRSRPTTTCRTTRTRRWNARRPPRASSTAPARSGRRSQSPQAARDRVAKRLNLPADKVTVNVTLLGGGFGRKSKADFVVEAALVSKEMGGKPVKLTWTREDDLHNDYFHAVSAQHLEAGLDANGKVIAWLHRTAEPTIVSIFAPDPKTLAAFELGLGLTGMPYAIPNVRIENPEATAHTRIGWLRAVNNIQHAFAAQSFIAEIAQAQGKDHRDYLLELLGPDRLIDPTQDQRAWNHGESPRALSDQHRAAAQGDRARDAGGGLGPQAARRARASGWRRTTASSPTWRRWSRSRVDAEGRADDPAHRRGGGLRAAGQSRPRALADRGRLRHGPEPGGGQRDHVQERPRRSRTTSTSSRSCA